MAKSIRIEGYLYNENVPVFEIDPKWWNLDEITIDSKFIITNESGSYFNRDADLTAEELKKLHEKFKPNLEKGLYSDKNWLIKLNPAIMIIEEAINSNKYSHFHICIYDWDSGF